MWRELGFWRRVILPNNYLSNDGPLIQSIKIVVSHFCQNRAESMLLALGTIRNISHFGFECCTSNGFSSLSAPGATSSQSQGRDAGFVYYDTSDMTVFVMDYWPTVMSEYYENARFEDNGSSVLFYFHLYLSPLSSPFTFQRHLNHVEAEKAAWCLGTFFLSSL